jgi:hypothetical protein
MSLVSFPAVSVQLSRYEPMELSPNDPFAMFDAAVEASFEPTGFAGTTFPSEMDAAEYSAWIDEHHVALSEAEELAMEAAYLANELRRELSMSNDAA